MVEQKTETNKQFPIFTKIIIMFGCGCKCVTKRDA